MLNDTNTNTTLGIVCRCERLNVSPSLGRYKKSGWPVDASHLELHHLLYFIPQLDTNTKFDTDKNLLHINTVTHLQYFMSQENTNTNLAQTRTFYALS